MDPLGNLFVVDTGNDRIRVLEGIGEFPPPYPAASVDFDGSGTVDFSDFLLFAGAFGSNDASFDLDGSGAVDFADFLGFAAVFGKSVLN